MLHRSWDDERLMAEIRAAVSALRAIEPLPSLSLRNNRWRRYRRYHALDPWQAFAQLRVAGTQPLVPPTSLVPLLWVAAFTVVLL